METDPCYAQVATQDTVEEKEERNVASRRERRDAEPSSPTFVAKAMQVKKASPSHGRES